MKSVYKYAIHSTKGERFQKTDVLFAFPASKLADVKSGIKIQKSIQAQELRTPERIKDRPLVVSDEQPRQDIGRRVRLLMRSGHVLRGALVFVSKFNLFLRITGKMVLVYRHSLLADEMPENASMPSQPYDSDVVQGSSCGDSKGVSLRFIWRSRWILCTILSVLVVRVASTYRR